MITREIRKALGRSAIVVAAFAAPFAATQAEPSFDGWSVSAGTINAAAGALCSTAGISCTPLVTGDGFLQQTVVDTTGAATVSYVQTIITDTGATGTPGAGLAYSDESFVRQDQTAGILSQQRTAQSTTAVVGAAGATSFTGTATLAMGWAQNLTTVRPDLNITQNLIDDGLQAVTGDEFGNSFALEANRDATGATTGKKMSIRQDVKMGTSTVTNNTTDVQSFVVEQRTGTQLPAAAVGGCLTLGAATGTVNAAAGTGGTVAWAAGEDVMVTWLGQTVNTQGGVGASTLSKFGFESITNLTTPATASTFSTINTGIDEGAGVVLPFAWDTAFGAAAPTVAPLP